MTSKKLQNRLASWGCLAGMLGVLLLSGCTDEWAESGTQGLNVSGAGQIVLVPDEARNVTVATKATAAWEETKIYNVWVIEFDVNGNTVACNQILNTNIEAATNGSSIIALTKNAETTEAYFIANTIASFSKESTKAAVQAEALANNTKSENGFAYSQGGTNYIPMFGIWKGAATDKISEVEMYRTLAKVSFEVKADLPQGQAFALQSLQVRQVPNTLQYYRDPGEAAPGETGGVAAYPALSESNVFDYEINEFKTEDIVGTWDAQWMTSSAQDAQTDNTWATVLGDGTSSVKQLWYLPESAQGVTTSTTAENQKEPDGQNVSPYSTYVEIKGFYKIDALVNSVTYRVYLGENNSNNFNILRNTHYTVIATVKGQNEIDVRVNEIEPENYLDYTDNGRPWFVMGDGIENASGAGITSVTCPDGWRVPTRKDLMMAWAYKLQPENGSLQPFLWTNETWSGGRWSVAMSNGTVQFMASADGSQTYFVRCVKDW